MRIANIGIIGTGHISNIYCENLTKTHENTYIFACADINLEAAKAKADQWGIPHVMTVEELLACPDIEIYIQSMTPVWTGGEVGGLNNPNVNAYNVKLREFAQQNGCHF